jgi:hypothetical protein
MTNEILERHLDNRVLEINSVVQRGEEGAGFLKMFNYMTANDGIDGRRESEVRRCYVSLQYRNLGILTAKVAKSGGRVVNCDEPIREFLPFAFANYCAGSAADLEHRIRGQPNAPQQGGDRPHFLSRSPAQPFRFLV